MENEYELPTKKEGHLSYLQGVFVIALWIALYVLGMYAIKTPECYCDYKYCIKIGDK